MQKAPLYRKVNTKAHGVHHRFGGDFREERNSKSHRASEAAYVPMHGKTRRGLDYTPLFKFLLSKVGSNWSDVYAEAVSRLDRREPIFWLVAVHSHEQKEYVRTGEASYFSGLRVDDHEKLQVVNPLVGPSSLAPQCKCCTHTFNGIPFSQLFDSSLMLSTSAFRVA
jgi:hypothetical protein